MPPSTHTTELNPALLQAAITLALAVLCGVLYGRYRKSYFLWWSVAWSLYLLRLSAIITFLATTTPIWLFWHQVVTGWTALSLLWAAMLFSGRRHAGRRYLLLALFPPVWSYVAIYRLDNFLLAAGPAVLFLSMATIWTGAVFASYARRTRSAGANFLAVSFLLWGLHHLDYPVLRARGTWNPWGYYLDIIFELAVGTGILFLVLEDVHRGLSALAALSGELQGRDGTGDELDTLLDRPLSLRGVRGSAVFLGSAADGRFVRGVGACVDWSTQRPEGEANRTIAAAISAGRPAFSTEWEDRRGGGRAFAYAAVLPIFRAGNSIGALIIVGDARDPFTALADDFLVALGQQVGAALENADLYRRLKVRTAELERLSARMIQQHEEQRRGISLELHDETAQVFSAVKLQLGVLRERAEPATAERLSRVLTLVDAGMKSIRNVTSQLRPSLLDDLGLLPALRALVSDFGERSGLQMAFDAPPTLPPLSADAELALFRALQEGLSNVARHAGAASISVRLRADDGVISLRVVDDGRGLANGTWENGRMGLSGMRERITALGGQVNLSGEQGQGCRLEVVLPADGNARP
ncbi:MAG: GAF domain-containing sensor histidine kinase [Gemmatimonadota bacterium]